MKQIEEIEKMSLEALETQAGDCSVKIPPTLNTGIARALTAAAAAGKLRQEEGKSHRAARYSIVGLITATAAGLLLLFTVGRRPHDTFDNPAEAYAQLERTLSYMTSKVAQGMDIASEANPVIEKTNGVINNLNAN